MTIRQLELTAVEYSNYQISIIFIIIMIIYQYILHVIEYAGNAKSCMVTFEWRATDSGREAVCSYVSEWRSIL